MIPDRRLSALLVKAGRLSQEQFEAARKHQSKNGGNLAEALEAIGVIGQEEALGIISLQMGRALVDLTRIEPSRESLALVDADFCRRHQMLPLNVLGDTLTVAMSDPFDVNGIDSMIRLTERKVMPVLVRQSDMRSIIDRIFLQHIEPDLRDMAELVQQAYETKEEPGKRVEVAEDVTEESAPIIRLANQIIEDAHSRGASDIHIEPFTDETLIRIRVDGMLETVMRLGLLPSRALVSRIKIMSKLNITERRLPQDGRISFLDFSRQRTDIDLRVSTLPVAVGEKVVMRLIDREAGLVGLDALGYSAENLKVYQESIAQPYGMILHVGPTGSGKTTTLYAALNVINRPEVNIVTAEDPIEYVLKGINQSHMRADIGYTFARALRSFLRQDPDVILVGEIRDLETASVAIEASLTGHLLFSTLHTNDAVATVTRLVEMGIEPFLVSSSLLCVCAQRLMRRLCKCAEKTPPTDSERRMLAALEGSGAIGKIGRPTGCAECNHTGFKGRTGTHEIMRMTPELQGLIADKAGENELREAAQASGMIPLDQDALHKVVEGITSLDEALRVVRIT